jgi:DNA-binding response OmpR family regulator
VPAVDSLGKPFSPEELAAKIAAALNGSASRR